LHQYINLTGGATASPYLGDITMDLVLVLLSIAGISFLSGFLLGMFLGDKYFYIDVKRKDLNPIPEVKGTTKRINILT